MYIYLAKLVEQPSFSFYFLHKKENIGHLLRKKGETQEQTENLRPVCFREAKTKSAAKQK